MPDEVLKFRCYRCNQLLAVAPSKAGAVVSCPKCKAELQVPGGEPQAKAEGEGRPRKLGETQLRREGARAPAAQSPSGQAPSPTEALPLPAFLEGVAATIPPEVAALRPEDLRVEAEFFASMTRPPAAPPRKEPVQTSVPVTPPAPISSAHLEALPANELASLLEPARAAPPSLQPAELVPPLREPKSPPVETSPVVPPIEVETPPIRPPGSEIRSTREVVLPAPVVLAWSVFVLAGITLSFIAGLMIGHYLWKVH
jgi:hypothetical protein